MSIKTIILHLLIITSKAFGRADNEFACYEEIHYIAKVLLDDTETILYAYDEDPTFIDAFEQVKVTYNINDRLTLMAKKREFKFQTYIINNYKRTVRGTLLELANSPFWNNATSPLSNFLLITTLPFNCSDFGEHQMSKVLILNPIDCHAYECESFVDDDPASLTHRNVFECADRFKRIAKPKIQSINALVLIKNFDLPYVDSRDPNELGGVLVEPIRFWAERYNLTLNFFEREWMYTTNPASLEAAQKLLANYNNGTIHVLISWPRRTRVRYEMFSATESILSANMMWVLPRRRKISNLRSIITIFGAHVWIGVFVVWLVTTCAYYCNQASKSFFDCCLHTLQMALGMGVNVPRGNGIRLWLLAFVIYALHVNNVFQGKFSSILTVPQYEGAITNVRDLLESSLTPYVHAPLQTAVRSADEGLIAKFWDKKQVYVDVTEGILNKLVMNNYNVAVPLFKRELSIAQISRVHVFEDTFFLGLEPVYLLRRGSPLLVSLNAILSGVHCGGLVKKWTRNYLNATNVGGSDTEQIVLSLEHISLPLMIIALGYALSFIVFSLELVRSYAIVKS